MIRIKQWAGSARQQVEPVQQHRVRRRRYRSVACARLRLSRPEARPWRCRWVSGSGLARFCLPTRRIRAWSLPRRQPVWSAAIHRGEQRVLQSLVIDVEGDESVEFARFDAAELAIARSVSGCATTFSSPGLWAALRTRPLQQGAGRLMRVPSSIFVTAIDTHPLAADPAPIITERSG